MKHPVLQVPVFRWSLVAGLALTVVLASARAATGNAPRRPGPINAKLLVDGRGAAQATITVAAGGHVAVTAANGTQITVTFPPGSVSADTPITATPVTKLSSRSLHPGLVAGVQLQPEGLRLLRPATVRFARRGRASRGTRLTFVGSDGSGRDVHRLPPPFKVTGRGRSRRVVVTSGPVVSINHFSTTEGFDWSTATVSEIDAISRPAQGEARLEQQFAQLLREHADAAELLEVVDHAFVHFIEPLLKVTSTRLKNSCSATSIRGGVVAIEIAHAFNRQAVLLGGVEPIGLDAMGAVLRDTATCMETLCPKLGDPRAGVYMIAIARQLQLLGVEDDGLFASLIDNLERCGTFEVHLDSRIDSQYAMANYSTRVEATIKVVPQVAVAPNLPPPRAPLTYTATSGAISDECDTTEISSTTPGELQLSSIAFRPYDPDHPTQDPIVSIKLEVTVPPRETLHTRYAPTGPGCTPPDDPLPDLDQVLWNTGFEAEHPGYMFPGQDFAPETAPKFAVAVYAPRTLPFAGGRISENTLVEIIQSPDPPAPLPG